MNRSNPHLVLVGVAGFEPATPASRTPLPYYENRQISIYLSALRVYFINSQLRQYLAHLRQYMVVLRHKYGTMGLMMLFIAISFPVRAESDYGAALNASVDAQCCVASQDNDNDDGDDE